MRIRMILLALMIGVGLLAPVQPAALAKTSYKHQKFKKFKARKFKTPKRVKAAKPPKHKAPRQVRRHV